MVSGILRNPVYIGRMTFRGEAVDAVHKSIITQELCDRTAKRLASRPTAGRQSPVPGWNAPLRRMRRVDGAPDHARVGLLQLQRPFQVRA
jgi:hypothetical protein